MGGCDHLWQQKTSVCPYGIKLPFDVTWPDAARAQSFGLSDDDLPKNALWILVNVVYGYVPTIFMVVQLLRLFVVRGSRELCIASILICTFIFNELILKQIFREPRPEYSCCTSCGMPSSHSAFAASLWAFHAWDLLWRLEPRLGWADWDAVAESALEVYRSAWRHWDALDSLQCSMLFLFWSVVLLPVPGTRVVLGDHSPAQVLAGSAVGLCVSTAVWVVTRFLLKNHQHQLDGKKSCGDFRLISHNMAVPIPSLLRRMQNRDLHPQEVQWYLARVTSQIKRLDSSPAPRPSTKKRFEEIQHTLQELLGGAGINGRNEDFSTLSMTGSSSHELSSFRSLQAMTGRTADRSQDLLEGSRGRAPTWPTPNSRRILGTTGEAVGSSIRGLNFGGGPGMAPLASEGSSVASASSSVVGPLPSAPQNPLEIAVHPPDPTGSGRAPAGGDSSVASASSSVVAPLPSAGPLEIPGLNPGHAGEDGLSPAWKSFGSTNNNLEGVAYRKAGADAPEVDAGSESSYLSANPADSPVGKEEPVFLDNANTYREELRSFLDGKDETRFVLRDRHGNTISIDDLRQDTLISEERFPLAVLKVPPAPAEQDGDDCERT